MMGALIVTSNSSDRIKENNENIGLTSDCNNINKTTILGVAPSTL
jgi:hypothetical protein